MGNEVVGVATATTDSDTLWQIGIDVHSGHRGKGLGAALTSQVARRVLDEGASGRIMGRASTISRRVGRRRLRGFYPCWVSVFTTGTELTSMGRMLLRGIAAVMSVALLCRGACVRATACRSAVS